MRGNNDIKKTRRDEKRPINLIEFIFLGGIKKTIKELKIGIPAIRGNKYLIQNEINHVITGHKYLIRHEVQKKKKTIHY